jgi:hypothetical protein
VPKTTKGDCSAVRSASYVARDLLEDICKSSSDQREQEAGHKYYGADDGLVTVVSWLRSTSLSALTSDVDQALQLLL